MLNRLFEIAIPALLLCLGGSMNTNNIHWLGHASFRIEDGTKTMYIDPWKISEKSPKADVILITHGHYDHFSPEDIVKIRTEKTIVVAPKNVARQIQGNILAVEPGKTYQAGSLKVTTVPAYNMNKEFHPKGNGWVGYIITLSNGERIYHSGDSDFIPEMKTVIADVAMMPCGGTYTMTAKEAAEAANSFKPKILIPMHWGDIVGSKADAETVKKFFKGETVIKEKER
jgi:L-ascorbate metabolism protein UlaG (beta-lactamase superfamily)